MTQYPLRRTIDSEIRCGVNFTHSILRHIEQAYNLDLFLATKPNEFELFASVFVFFLCV